MRHSQSLPRDGDDFSGVENMTNSLVMPPQLFERAAAMV